MSTDLEKVDFAALEASSPQGGYLSTSVGMIARELDRAIRRAIDARVARFGLAAHTCRYLAIMQDRGSITPKELSDLLGVRSPTVLAVLKTLEAAKLIRKARDSTDARRSPYALTPRGSEIEDIVRRSAIEVETMALSKLSSDQIDQFRLLTQLIKQALDQGASLSADHQP